MHKNDLCSYLPATNEPELTLETTIDKKKPIRRFFVNKKPLNIILEEKIDPSPEYFNKLKSKIENECKKDLSNISLTKLIFDKTNLNLYETVEGDKLVWLIK